MTPSRPEARKLDSPARTPPPWSSGQRVNLRVLPRKTNRFAAAAASSTRGICLAWAHETTRSASAKAKPTDAGSSKSASRNRHGRSKARHLTSSRTIANTGTPSASNERHNATPERLDAPITWTGPAFSVLGVPAFNLDTSPGRRRQASPKRLGPTTRGHGSSTSRRWRRKTVAGKTPSPARPSPAAPPANAGTTPPSHRRSQGPDPLEPPPGRPARPGHEFLAASPFMAMRTGFPEAR